MKKIIDIIYLYLELIKLDILLRLYGFTKVFDSYVKKYGILGTNTAFEADIDLRSEVGKLLILIQVVSTFYPFGAKCMHRSLLGYKVIRKRYKVPIDVVVGISKFPFGAHAWLVYETYNLTDDYISTNRYQVILHSSNYLDLGALR
jgi:hypothetical protein